MPAQYTEQNKRDAMDMLSIGDDVSFVHYTTGVPERTLRRWRQKIQEQSDGRMAEKSSAPATGHWPREADDLLANPSGADATPAPADNASNATSFEDYSFIRDKLMQIARQMTATLDPDAPDVNRRTLALSRILDRLDQLLPNRDPAPVIRHGYFYDGQVQEHPPWHGTRAGNPRATLPGLQPPKDEPG